MLIYENKFRTFIYRNLYLSAPYNVWKTNSISMNI